MFWSGLAALIYQVLWMKQVGLLFGNTAHATGTTLAAFFIGLASGSWLIGRYVSSAKNPMRIYAWLEAGVAITALLYFGILAIYQTIYPAIYQSVGSGIVLLAINFFLSLLLILPPAFFMGGTIPVIGQYLVRQQNKFGALSAFMYGINTLGAALGAALAGFYLPVWLGFNATCCFAIIISAGVACLAYRLSKHTDSEASQPIKINKRPSPKEQGDRKIILFFCGLSGFGILALEVLWTRLFAQVLENSVYTFAAILVVVLICLALGALLSSRLARIPAPPYLILTILIVCGASFISATPTIFLGLTNGMQLVSSIGSWNAYILLIFSKVALAIGPSAILLGTIFPYLMKLEERHLKSPGLSLGQLATANTIGAIIGALLCGFVLLDWLGMWRCFQIISLLYLISALMIPLAQSKWSLGVKSACIGVFLLTIFALNPRSLPVTSIDPLAAKETVIEAGKAATVPSQLPIAVSAKQFGLIRITASVPQEPICKRSCRRTCLF